MRHLSLRPNAKLNLGLRVLRRREDGFHDLETIFIPLRPLCDELEVEVYSAREGISLEVGGEYETGSTRENLVWRAYECLRPYGPPGVRISLEKRIPVGAGLGGGSADAAFFLQALASHCERALSGEELAALALGLGSDCPFFLRNAPSHALGRGEILTPLGVPFRAWVVLLAPRVHVSTGWAFAQLGGRPSGAMPVMAAFSLPKREWQAELRNDFLPVIQSAHPEVGALLDQLKASGAYYVSLSGSGPVVYGLYEGPVEVSGAIWSGWVEE